MHAAPASSLPPMALEAPTVLGSPLRLAALRATGLLPGAQSPRLDRLTRAATRLLGVPMALVSLVDDEHQWIAGQTGLTGPLAETRRVPLTHSLCKHVVASGAPLVVDDATVHPLVSDSPAVLECAVRGYLAVPITSADGQTLGALCAVHTEARCWSAADQEVLADLAVAAEAELRLRAREQRFQLAVEATQEVFYARDHAADRVERHGAVEALFGRPASQLPPTTDGWLACVAAEDRARVAASWGAALTGGVTRWTCEYRFEHPDGMLVVVEDRARIEVDAAGMPLRVAGAIRDVTRERVAEEALQASEARWRRLLEVAYEGICSVDATGTITYANPRLAAMLGRARHALPGTDFFTLLDPEEADAARVRFARRRQGISETRELALRRADGTRLWAHESASPVFDTDGTFAGTLFLLTDVSDRRAAEAERAVAEAALRASEARLRLALDAAGMTAWERDPATDHLRDLIPPPAGAPVRADDLGDYAGFLAMVHPEDRDRVAQVNAEAIAGRGDFAIEHRVVGANGAVRWLRSVGRMVGGDGTGPRRLAGVAVDVTEQRSLEERLRQAQKMEAVGQLAGGIAHDFNNLLTIISANLEFLRGDLPADLPPSHPAREDAEGIAQAAERARALVRQLLTFSRKQPVHPQRLDLAALVRGTKNLLGRVIGEEIALAVEVADADADTDTCVEADPGQLEQVLLNLAVNARDAMLTPRHGHHGRGGTLTLSVDAVTLAPSETRTWDGVAPGRWVRLRVRDTGHGMDASTQAHAFEPFFTTKDVGAGTGLGLATVFGIVRQARGAVRVDSAPGRGTTFTLLLPALARPAGPAAGPSGGSAVAPAEEPPAAGPVATILLVEDEPGVRSMARRLFERRGYQVRDAANGALALAVWAEHGSGIDVVVTDVRMPQLGGPELVARLRTMRPTLPVVFLSGYTDRDPQGAPGDRAGPWQPEAFLSKPFTGDALLGAVARVLGDPCTADRSAALAG
jgi:PAS domain S-box-containing protein